MSATKQRGTMPEAERLARRERRILKRVAAYEALLGEHVDRREHLVELLWDGSRGSSNCHRTAAVRATRAGSPVGGDEDDIYESARAESLGPRGAADA